MNLTDSPTDEEARLGVAPELESIRSEFRAETAAWLPSWYKSHALKIATQNRWVSEALGEDGLRHFKQEVEQTGARAQQIVDLHLGEDVWWQHDPGMDAITVIYSVRLCMGLLAVPLQHAGYIGADEWREVTRHHYRTRHEKDEQGAFVHPEEMTLVPVPTNRFFFSLGQEDANIYNTEDWSPKMKSLISAYFIAIIRAQRRIKVYSEQCEAAAKSESEARIKSVLEFAALNESAAA